MEQRIKLIVGLGNPGQQYQDTRHNTGAWFVEQLLQDNNLSLRVEKKFKGEIAKASIAGHEVLLLLPTTFMNLSGESVLAVANFYKIPPQAILIAHDELDLPVGDIRLKADGGGHGGHNGLRSTVACLHSKDFLRLRIGIGHPGDSRRVTDYVLHRASKAEQQQIEEAIWQAERLLPDILVGDYQKVMTALHTKES